MTKRKTTVAEPAPRTRKRAAKPEADKTEQNAYAYCALPEVAPREFDADINPLRAFLILASDRKWVNGTVLHYYFFDKPTDGTTVMLSNGTSEFRSWVGAEAQKAVVRAAFKAWKDVGIGLEFKEVATREEAEVRIGFMRGDGSWSYIGRDILGVPVNARTMNFGWDLTRPGEIDTAIHEIGHTLGFPHEHQNPYAGIVWDEEAVYRALAQPPNNWDRQKTFYNIIRKIEPDTVQGSNWDPNSVMHYPFGPGMILEPPEYRNGLQPAGGLSERDKAWVQKFYPPLKRNDYKALKPFQSVPLALKAGEQANFIIEPAATRRYEMRTFGEADTVMVLFEDDDGKMRYITGDDDSGEDTNAYIKVKLFSGRRYILRLRLYYVGQSGETAVMLW